jgi:hypothetical protein
MRGNGRGCVVMVDGVWYDDDWEETPSGRRQLRGGGENRLWRQRAADSRAETGTEVEIDCGSKVEVEGAEAEAKWSVSHNNVSVLISIPSAHKGYQAN